METNRDDRINAAVRAAGDDRVIAAVRAARDAYAALHGHDVAAIFEDIRAAQEASGRVYVRVVPRNRAHDRCRTRRFEKDARQTSRRI